MKIYNDLTVTGNFTTNGNVIITPSGKITDGTHEYTLPSSSGTLALTADLNSYLPLSGGTLTGPVYWSGSTALPQKTLQYILGIDAFASGGQTGWQSKENFLSDCVTLSTAQTITAIKTYNAPQVLANTIALKGKTSDGTAKALININSADNVIINADNQAKVHVGGSSLAPLTDNAKDLGWSTFKWKDLYLAGDIKDGTYTYTLPDKTGTFAVTSDIKNATLTIQQNGTSVGTFSANASSNATVNIVTSKVYRYI